MSSSSRPNRVALRSFIGKLSLLLFVMFQGLVWYPEFERHYVPRETVTSSMTEQGRTQPFGPDIRRIALASLFGNQVAE